MLKLERLEISGFKSFVDPVSMNFAGGLTAIVGPNGCGKSNISDAVTWVLGEQSAKTLRGATMEDVIFNGTEARKPVGMADVEMVLSTDPSLPHAQDGRITIARRVFRTGESQYRLNGKTVRLKDIRDLLMDTGLGLRAYSVIEQGRIGMILSGKPLERRKLLEEAAGITRYKARKRIAEIKLEEATENLLRLDDIISEVERSLRSLKRQVGAARRYQEKQAEQRTLVARVLHARWRRVGDRLAAVAEQLAAASKREAELAADLAGAEAELAGRRESVESMAEKVSAEHQRRARLAAVIEGRQELIKGSRRALQDLGERMESGTAQAERRGSAAEERRARLSELEAQRADLVAHHEQAQGEASDDQRRIGEVEALVAEAGTRLESLRSRLLGSLAEVTDLRNRMHREEVESEKAAMQQTRLKGELLRRGEALAQADEAATDAANRADELATAVRAAEERAISIRESLEGRRQKLNEQLQELQRLEREIDTLTERRQILRQLSKAQSERRQEITRVVVDCGLEEARFLGDLWKVPAGWEESLDLYLGDLSEAVVVDPDVDTVDLAARLLATTVSSGRYRIVRPVSDGIPGSTNTEIEDPAILAPLGRALGLPPALARALPTAYLVAARSDAERLARLHPTYAFIARERMWAQAGTLHLESPQAQPGTLSRQRDLADLESRLPELEANRDDLVTQREALEEATSGVEEELRNAESELAGLRQEQAVAVARRDDLAGRRQRLAIERQTCETELQEVEQALERLHDQRKAMAAELATREQAHGELETAFDHAQDELDQAREQREEVRTSGASRRSRLELVAERLRAHQHECERLSREVASLGEEEERWSAERDSLRTRRAELEGTIRAAEEELQEALEENAAGAEGVRTREEELAGARLELKELEARVQEARQKLDAEREAVSELKVTQASHKQDAEHITQSFHEELNQAPPDRGSSDVGEEPDETKDLAELEEELERVKATLERLGPVNLLAAEEHEEQQERHEFLTTQREDVAKSVESLKRTIREINQTSSERFRTAFAEVNETFGRTFTQLFRGGEAEMRLLDEEDLLESGIEIVARPPGKRLQNIMLLSGGEKALTAIALLFALFRTKPSPFCILDEVDAPLDDVNTVRFVDLLKNLASDTQFIVITHNKLSMEAASLLYGVTMEEKGVSKLVSVSLDDLDEDERASA